MSNFTVDRTIFNDLYCSLFEKVVENQTIIDYAQKAIVKDSKISVRSVSPYRKTQVNFLNGNQFYGDINEQCQFNGSGRYLWESDGSLFEGDFLRPNVIEGRGSFKFRNSVASTGFSRFCGSFANDMYHGKGQLTNYFFKYNGNFECDKFHGKGCFKTGIESFNGCFMRGKKVSGMRVYTNGTFTGDFDEKEMRKYGKYQFDNGDSYCGSFLSGQFHGFGEYYWKSCDSTYTGFWKENYRHGLGKLIVNGSRCITNFKHSIKNGPGIVLARNGSIYLSKCMFVNDEFKGCVRIDVNHESIEIVRRLFNLQCESTYGIRIPQFASCIAYLEDKFAISSTTVASIEDDDDEVYPFHLTWFHLNVRHEVIWDFVRRFLSNADQELEFSSISQFIREHVSTFEECYQKYAKYSQQVLGRGENEAAEMTRVGLWQFFRDLRIYQKGSAFNTQAIIENAEKEFNILTINSYDPFEVVSIANFLHYLLYIVLHINRHHAFVFSCAINQRTKNFGLFATMFIIFMREFMPNTSCVMQQEQEQKEPINYGNLSKLIHDDKTFFVNFINIIGGNQMLMQKLSIRDVFKIIEQWRNNIDFSDGKQLFKNIVIKYS